MRIAENSVAVVLGAIIALALGIAKSFLAPVMHLKWIGVILAGDSSFLVVGVIGAVFAWVAAFVATRRKRSWRRAILGATLGGLLVGILFFPYLPQ